MQTFKTLEEAKKYAIQNYGSDYFEFGITKPFKLSTAICANFSINNELAGNYAISNEFDEIYA